MKNLTPEMIEKLKAAKSAEELVELAKANGIEMTADEAEACFEQLNGALDDDALGEVAGGGFDSVVPVRLPPRKVLVEVYAAPDELKSE